jgi:two-component system OmpR family sensor kinase
MKLLEKTNRTYLLVSGAAFAFAGVVIYFALSCFFEVQLNEKLMSDIDGIVRKIERNDILPEYFPFIEVKEVPDRSERPFETLDTLIFDPSEKENIPFRQISIVKKVSGKKYYIASRDTLLEKSDLLLTIVIITGSVFILLLISLYFINRKLSLNIWKPFYKTLDDLKEFSHDKPGFRLTSTSQLDEFSELNETLEKLTRRVISDYQSLKRFTEDASHEIQTPLAIVQSKLETLLQDPDLKKDQFELINSAYSSALRISKLTQTLLLLTKIANDQFPEKRSINMAELIEEKIKLFEDHFIGKSLALEKAIKPECFLETNIFLAESMISNLIGNAAKHCIKGGKIDIVLDENHLEISNSGSPLSVPSSKLFERFYKINKSAESQGLGLSIVKEICSLNKWEIRYQYEDNQHKFIVIF